MWPPSGNEVWRWERGLCIGRWPVCSVRRGCSERIGPERIGTWTVEKVGLPARMAMGAVRFYQRWISPLLGDNCRFHPTCSQYMVEALGRFGLLKGLWLGTARILRCGPWHPGGYDPVPEVWPRRGRPPGPRHERGR